MNALRIVDRYINHNLRIICRGKSDKGYNMLRRGITSVDDFLCSTCLTTYTVAVYKSRTTCAFGNYALKCCPHLLGCFLRDDLPNKLRLYL
ncbi:hypothetical protein D3C76_1600310 [compost metagenome]